MCAILNFVEIKKDLGKCGMVFADGLVLNMSYTISNYMCTYLSKMYICVDISSCWYLWNSCCLKHILLKKTLRTTVVHNSHRISMVLFNCHSFISNFSPNVKVDHMSIKHSQGYVESNSHRVIMKTRALWKYRALYMSETLSLVWGLYRYFLWNLGGW